MSGHGKELFDRLQSAESIKGLIGLPEDVHFECKEWTSEAEAQKMLAKAACGMTNAEGGVVLVGMKARRSQSKDDPDVVDSEAPVSDTSRDVKDP